MTDHPRSLARRLLIGAAGSTAIALLLVITLLHQVLTRFITGQIDQRLDDKIVSLVSQIRVGAGGTVALASNADGPPYDDEHQGSFWVVQGPRNVLQTAWLAHTHEDVRILQHVVRAENTSGPPMPVPERKAEHPRSLDDLEIGGARLHARFARLQLSGGIDVTILVAAPATAISRPVGEAMVPAAIATGGLGIALATLAVLQVSIGLRPLRRIRAEIAAVSEGRRERLSTTQPGELLPLVEELNRLLAQHAQNLDAARRHVANLAHGLRTPLATLQLGLERLGGNGSDELRAVLAQVDLRIRHHLGRARAGVLAGPEGLRTQLKPSLTDLADALRRIYADRSLTFELVCGDDAFLACERNDVDEIFGNLLDNAFKHARSRVSCDVALLVDLVRVEVQDDGAGLTADDINHVMEPGKRLDETMPGFGFGLPIARELVELYGGALEIVPSNGLRVTVQLPRRS